MNKIQEPKIRFISKNNHLAVFKWICPYIIKLNFRYLKKQKSTEDLNNEIYKLKVFFYKF
jgi:hypothetical protein